MAGKTGKIVTEKKGSEGRLRHPLAELHREVNRLFEDYSLGLPNLEFEPFRWMKSEDLPAIDFAEQENEYVLTAELPGLQESDFDITLSNHALTLKGEKTEEIEEKEKGYYLSERHYGSFERTIQLPEYADTSGIDASFKDGVLRILIPKSEETKTAEQKIPVKSA